MRARARTTHRGAFGWSDFDQEVVEGLVENDSRFINRRAGGWIASPLLGHYDSRLPWKDDNFKKGSVPVGDPPVSFRAAPTYVLERPLDNVIAGRELIADAVAGRWGNPEATRFGNESSEGALTWNVFRTLQESGRLGVAHRSARRVRADGRAGALLLGSADHDRCRDRLGRARDDARRARAWRDTARRTGRVPPRARLRLGRDRGELRPELRRLRRPRAGRGVPRALCGCVPRALRRGANPDDATARRPSAAPAHARHRSLAESGRRARRRDRTGARERHCRRRAENRPLPCRHGRRRLPSRHVGVALPGTRPGRFRARAATPIPGGTRASASAPPSRSTTSRSSATATARSRCSPARRRPAPNTRPRKPTRPQTCTRRPRRETGNPLHAGTRARPRDGCRRYTASGHR